MKIFQILLLSILMWLPVGAGASADVPDDEFEFMTADYTTSSTKASHRDTIASITTFGMPVAVDTPSYHTILGEPIISDASVLCNFVRRNNPTFPVEIAEAYIRIGRLYGIRGDVAICQAIIETGWFRFADGTAVKPDQHNYCGLGVTGRGMTGASFETIDEGVTAQIQHLYAYCCKSPVPKGESVVDPRFQLVSRGVATTWHDLSNRWAMNKNYGVQIMTLYDQLLQFASRK
ncbi:MAG: glucosaminidase domain-containing protein [Bacteroides sp.]|nr:glucosaminidase domain-containing protein [Bacteroides sp.]MCM1413596.1 glucosaminidase domain-containing protein [Bacteroides sp.]MCM1471187.1 glucosaminidase domain-containing protein [Bacteroides sp.]